MEPEGSLPCSQEPSTGPYPDPDRSSPHHPILSTHLRIGLPSSLFPSGFLTNILYAFLFAHTYSKELHKKCTAWFDQIMHV
jgi:hypothetical protein